jgi:vacuolar-type H+-ATPase subunit E/Vma4
MESKIQKIAQQILDDAMGESKSIVDDAQKSVDTMVEKRKQLALQNARKEAQVRMKNAEREAEIIKGKVTMEMKREAHWKVLSEKENLTNTVFKKIMERLQKLQKSEDYVPILEKLIINAGSTLGGGKLEVSMNENMSSRRLNLNSLEEVLTEKTGVETKLAVSNDIIKSIGVKVKTVDGKITIDNTFEAIIKRREKELRSKIMKILFEDS